MGKITQNSIIDFGTDHILVYSRSEKGLDEICQALKKSGADYSAQSSFKSVKRLLKQGNYKAFLSDVTDLDEAGMNLLEYAQNISDHKIKAFGYIRTEHPNVIADLYYIASDQCFYREGLHLENMTQMMMHLYVNNKDLGWMKKISEERNNLLTHYNRDSTSVKPILLMGPPGSGKIAFSQIFHSLGGRNNFKFVLGLCEPHHNFTHTKSFKSASATTKNRIREGLELMLGHAYNGTAFFHNVSKLTKTAQEIMADVLAKGLCRMRSGEKLQPYKGRIVVSSNVDLKKLVDEGKFDAGLYDVISTNVMTIPSLSDYQDEIPFIARTFATVFSLRAGASPMKFTEDAANALERHVWKRNIRELYEAIDESMTFAKDGIITLLDLPLSLDSQTISNNEKRSIERVLIENKGKIKRAAVNLGMSKGKLYRRIEALGIDLEHIRNAFKKQPVE